VGLLDAVLPDIQPYQPKHVRIEPEDLPIGYEIGENSFTYEPAYKSGAVIRVGTDASVFAGGVLLDSQLQPLPQELGLLFSLSAPSKKPAEFFTNREGSFFLYELTPGEYRLVLPRLSGLGFDFAVPEKTAGFLDLGRVSLSPLTKVQAEANPDFKAESK
jgi:outer membrane usher protein